MKSSSDREIPRTECITSSQVNWGFIPTTKQKKIEELFTDQFVGEMGGITGAPRSATVVALMDNTQVEYLTEADFDSFFQQNPPRVIQMMQQMCFRLRRITRKYLEECREAYNLIEQDSQAPAGDES